MTERWLSIIGIGEDGRDGLSPSSVALLDAAELVIGGRRHLDLVGETRGEQLQWLTPLDATVPVIEARRGRPVCVLASGDPFWFGVGVTLVRHISIDEMLVIPAPSSLSLAASRMGWALQEAVTVGLNMRGLTPLIRRHCHHGTRILALSLNAETPGEVAAMLTAAGFGGSRMTILQALGGPRERRVTTTAEAFQVADINPLNIIAVDVRGCANARPIGFAAGLPDEMFDHDGQITKREIRAITLSSLQPSPYQLLWDIGLGSGSVAIEWLLAHATTRAIGFERDRDRASRAARNAAAIGVPHLETRVGAAAQHIYDAPDPDAIFIGGGASEAGMIDRCWSRLKPGGRMVVNAVTVETETLLFDLHRTHGGSLTRLSIDRLEEIGTKRGWRPAMPVVQWCGKKP